MELGDILNPLPHERHAETFTKQAGLLLKNRFEDVDSSLDNLGRVEIYDFPKAANAAEQQGDQRLADELRKQSENADRQSAFISKIMVTLKGNNEPRIDEVIDALDGLAKLHEGRRTFEHIRAGKKYASTV